METESPTKQTESERRERVRADSLGSWEDWVADEEQPSSNNDGDDSSENRKLDEVEGEEDPDVLLVPDLETPSAESEATNKMPRDGGGEVEEAREALQMRWSKDYVTELRLALGILSLLIFVLLVMLVLLTIELHLLVRKLHDVMP